MTGIYLNLKLNRLQFKMSQDGIHLDSILDRMDIGRVSAGYKNKNSYSAFCQGNMCTPSHSLTPWSSRGSNLCQGTEAKPLILAFSPNTNLTLDFMTDIKYVIQSQNGSELFNVDKGILNRACWFTGPRIVELKARIIHTWAT